MSSARAYHGYGGRFGSYFTEFSFQKGSFYVFVAFFVVSISVVSILSPLLLPLRCREVPVGVVLNSTATEEENLSLRFGNALYQYTPCRFERIPSIMFLTPDECSYARRLIAAVFLGGVIGWERRSADRPAGIRTMALVCLGSSLFTICSTFAFLDGPMSWDSSRISAAIPSGVGFLGAGLIFKQAEKDEKSGDTTHVVHGLTTSASVWVAAAVGVACGGEMYMAATFCVGVMVLLLRFGPRIRPGDEDDDDDEEFGHFGADDDEDDVAHSKNASVIEQSHLLGGSAYQHERSQLPKKDDMSKSSRSRSSVNARPARKKANLSTMV